MLLLFLMSVAVIDDLPQGEGYFVQLLSGHQPHEENAMKL